MDRAVGSGDLLHAVADPVLEVGTGERARSTGVRAQYRRIGMSIAATDGLATLLAWLIAYQIQSGLHRPPADVLSVIAICPFLWIAIFAGFGLYSVHRLAPSEEFRRMLAAVSMGVMAVALISFWSKSSLSREWVGFSWALSLLLVPSGRRLWHWYIRVARRRGSLAFPTLIVGTNGEATPAHIARVASSEAEPQVERWARGLEHLAFGPTPPDAASEQVAGVTADPKTTRERGID